MVIFNIHRLIGSQLMLDIKSIENLIPTALKNSNQIYLGILDIDGQIFFAGKKFEELFSGKVTSEVNLAESLHPDFDLDVHAFLLDVTGKPNDPTVIEFVHKNCTVQWEFSMLQNDEGDFNGIMAVGVRQPEEVEPYGQEQLFPKNISPDTDIYFQVNQTGKILKLNSLAEKFFGKPKEDLIQQSIWQIYKDHAIYHYALEFKKAKETKTLRVFEDFNESNGRWYKVYILPRKLGLDVILKDITEIHRLSEEFVQVSSNLRTLMDQSDESIFLVGKDLRILEFNVKAAKLVKSQFGKSIQKGDKFLNYIFEGLDERFLKDVERLLAGKTIQYEKEINHVKAGLTSWYNHRFYPLMNASDSIIGFVYACKDIDTEKSSMDELKRKNKVMREIIQSQNMSLRSPLSSILGLLELVDSEKLNKENQKFFSYLKPLAQEMDQVIRNNSKQISNMD